MFEALTPAPAVENVEPAPAVETGISFESALQFATDACFDVLNATDGTEDDRLEATITNLVAFESAVTQFGLSRALVAFADHDKTLSAAIAAIPAIETMSADLTVEDSAAAIEGVGTTIKSVVKATGAGIGYELTHIFSYNQAEARIVMWKHLVDGIEKNMAEKKFNPEEAKRITVEIVPLQGLLQLQKAFLEAPAVVASLWSTELPTKAEEFEPWLAKIRSHVEPVFKSIEAKITDKGTLSVPLKRQFLLKVGEKGTLAAKGYTSEGSVKEVIAGFRKLLQAYLSLKAIRKTAETQVNKLTKEGAEFDRDVAKKAVKVAKNVSRALMFDGLWGVSGLSMHAIGALKRAYTHTGDYEGEAKPKE